MRISKCGFWCWDEGGWATHRGEGCQVAERSQGGSLCPLGIPHEVGICGRRREIAYYQ